MVLHYVLFGFVKLLLYDAPEALDGNIHNTTASCIGNSTEVSNESCNSEIIFPNTIKKNISVPIIVLCCITILQVLLPVPTAAIPN